MKKAVHAVLVNSLSHKRAARQYGVPRSSLIRYLHKVRAGDGGIDRNIGRPCILSEQQENYLSQVIQNMESRLFGLTLCDVRKLVYVYCVKNRIPNNFSEKSGMAGRSWMDAFRKRHPEISLRKPEAVSVQRASGFNRSKVDRFYEVLEGSLFSDGKRAVPPENIFNVDESGYTVVQKPHKVLAKSGKKNVSQITSGERGKTITTICCVSAAGQYVPPMFIFLRKNMNQRLMDNAPPSCIGTCTPTGRINEDKFTMWFDHFINTVQPQARQCPTLLIFDGHASCIRNIDLIDKARDNNVTLLCLPSHCTHKLQPLDVSFFKSMNWQYDEEIRNWMRDHDARHVTEFDVAGIFAKAYAKAATVKNAISGFQKCGIHPFCKDLFTDEDFLGADFTDNPLPTQNTIPALPLAASTSQTSSQSSHGEVVMPVVQSSQDVPLAECAAVDACTTINTCPDDTASTVAQNSTGTSEEIQMSSSSADNNVCDNETADPPPDPPPDVSGIVCSPRFSELVQVPKQLRKSSLTRKRRVAHAEIISASPYKNELKEKKLRLENECTTKTKKTKTLKMNSETEANVNKVSVKKVTKSTRKKGVSKKRKPNRDDVVVGNNQEDDAVCLYCPGTYKESVEGWIQCTGQCNL